MDRPEDIPEDVWARAQSFAFGTTGDMETDTNILVSRAIMAERERWTKVVESFRDPNPFPTVYEAIAAAIRKGDGR